jgi:NAD(P)-dependent dehydrogenase (short-subunit alcohol dehydrogenase family)
MKDLAGRTAVVTGAASGIGLALTERFVAAGMSVVMADIEEEALAREAMRLESDGAAVLGVLTDVRDPAAVEALRDQALSVHGSVHVLCNNAGVGPAGPMAETTAADWRWTVDVNILGVAHGVIAFTQLFLDQGEGHIVNTASEAGLVTNPALGMYCATKHAVVGMSEALWREVHPQGIGVGVLCPNLVDTKIFDSERNRTDGVEMSPGAAATMAPLREIIGVMGIPTATVADRVHDAIVDDRFWILTHDTTLPAAGHRFEDLSAGRNPSDPYAGSLDEPTN